MAYAAKDITVLKGLEPVRERPGMYIGSTGPSGLHHLVYEVVDNAVDEAMAGYCTRIDVTIQPDGACTVSDNGRGIPVDKHPESRTKSAAEVVMTTLHAGGKFGGDGYKISGGLHGVGVSVVNALSSRLDLRIQRDGANWEMHFAKGGRPQGKLKKGKPSKKTGTTITFWPDVQVFDDVDFRAQTLVERLREMAFLNKGLEIRFTDKRSDPEIKHEFRYSGGIVDFVKHLNASKDPLFKRVASVTESNDDAEVDVAIQWNTGYHEGLHSFANNIATTEGGMHEEGFKKALTNVINKYGRARALLKEKDGKLLGEDIREGMTAIVSVKLRDPQFEGQTKTKLGNTEMRSMVEKTMNEKFADWLEEHPAEGRRIIDKSAQAAHARQAARQARDLTRRKSLLDSAAMPGKLADCVTRDPERAEIFIVEGDSAGGPAKQARDRDTQAILPIRGKILNVERARIDRMLKNEEIQALITAVGAGVGDDFDIEKARYHKLVLLTDADVDGAHIRTLLLTFLYRQMHPMLERGYVYVAQPPLYSVVLGKDKIYLKDDAALEAFRAEHEGRKLEIGRFKGLGEMDYGELWETTMDPATRSLLRVSIEEVDALADDMFSRLMGDDVDARRSFIQQNAADVRFLDV
ncbi:MAG: DNA topoisomerase (ATP-hydrolyzing) subunit B [Acidimicrobiia bacterium]|nr:DNA topoisomerase (ATP-hydrolyzing) subunit B [Acidimicrobiia bacterium]